MAEEYKVLAIDQLTRRSDTRGVEPYFRIMIKTKGGVTRSVDVDEDVYQDEKKVTALLLKEALHADKIKGL